MTKEANTYLKPAYLFIFIILWLPTLLWPIPLTIFDNPGLPSVIIPTWQTSLIILLMVSVAMDTMLYGFRSKDDAINATLWIGFISLFALQNHDNTWFIAMLFFAHSLRAAYRHLRPQSNQSEWWQLWAWARDTLTSLVTLTWLSII